MTTLSVEERWEGATQYLYEMDFPLIIAGIREAMVAVLDEAERCYAQNYDGANEGDDVAMGLLELRARIAALGSDSVPMDRDDQGKEA